MKSYIKKRTKAFIELFIKRRSRFSYNTAKVKQPKFFEMSSKHVFFGYYDLTDLNAAGDKALVHVVGKNANTSSDQAEIGYFDLESGEYRRIASTRAWCWQQGSRLRWHPLYPDVILFNDVYNNEYVVKSVDIGTKEAFVLTTALYDISFDFKYGIGLNFSRLQRLRPGYGYSVLPDLTKDVYAPEDDGVFLADMENRSLKLVVSLHELSQKCDNGATKEHYINHVSFSPDGSMFIFFHITMDVSIVSSRKIYLYLYRIDTGMLELVEGKWTTSHYCWSGANELMTTAIIEKGKTAYVVYDMSTMSKKVIENKDLKSDGHPSFFSDNSGFVYDTYPDRNSFQKLLKYDTMTSEATVLSSFYHTPIRIGELRCDLHPRLWENEGKRVITLDTTCSSGLRKVALLELLNN